MPIPDYIVAFPYSSNVERTDNGTLETYPSKPTEIVTYAATRLLEQFPAAILLVPGETAYSSEDVEGITSTTDHMLNQARHLGVPEDKLQGLYALPSGQTLNNTFQQARVAAQFIPQGASALGVTYDFHQPRSQAISDVVGLQSDFMSVEAILREADDHSYDQYLPHVNRFAGNETVGLWLAKRRRAGELLNNGVTRIRGGQIVDLSLSESGAIVSESTTARIKVKELKKLAGQTVTSFAASN